MSTFTAPPITNPALQRHVKVRGVGVGMVEFKTEADALAFDAANAPLKGDPTTVKQEEGCPLGGEHGSILHMSRPCTAKKPRHVCGVSNDRAIAVKRTDHTPTTAYVPGSKKRTSGKIADPFRAALVPM